MTTTTAAPTSASASTGFAFRHDVQWLRALAVLAVFAYHLDVPGTGGGYVGVDVFFVVSGYLITRLLLLEHERTGSIDLRAFATRRIRRLLPVSTVVLLATLVWLWLSAGVVRRAAERTVALGASLFGANVSLALERSDYLTAEHESALQHYWSLGVEEQFYLLWPALLLGTLWVARRRSWGIGPATAAIGGLVAIGSLAVAAAQTGPNQPFAFFLLPARAWELMAGVVVAGLEHRGLRPSRPTVWRWLGLGLVVATVVGVLAGQFPWPLAVAPVAGTMALLWSGIADGGPRWMRDRTMQWIGDRSFGLYLWHWPPLVLLGLTKEEWSNQPLLRVGVVAGTFAATALTYRVVEEPLRRGPLLRGHLRPALFLVTAVATSVATVLAVTPGTSGGQLQDRVRSAIDDRGVSLADVPDELPDLVRAQLATAAGDQPAIYDNGCHAPFEPEAPPPVTECTFGTAGASTTVALIGDSHAAHWFPAARVAAEELGWELVAMTKSSCPLYEVDVRGEPYPQCPLWREAVLDELERIAPDVVLVAGAGMPRHRADAAAWEAGTRAGLERVRAALPATPVVMLLDAPNVPDRTPVPVCLDERPLADCHLREDPAFDEVQRRVGADLADAVLDTPALVCDQGLCPAVVDETLVYRDSHHFSIAFSERLWAVLADAVEAATR